MKEKLKINELKVSSFTTSEDIRSIATIKGGQATGANDCGGPDNTGEYCYSRWWSYESCDTCAGSPC